MAWASCYTPDFRVMSNIGAGAGTTAPNDRRIDQTSNGSWSFVADAIDTGRYAIRANPTSNPTNIQLCQMLTASRYTGMLCRFRFQSAFTTTVTIMKLAASTDAQSCVLRVNTSGVLGYSMDNGTSYTNTTTTLVQGTVYRLEGFVDWNTGTTHTLKVRFNGVEIINTTGGTATSTAIDSTSSFGSVLAAASMLVDYADLITYNDVAQYGVLTDWRVVGLEPLSDGTHSMTANDFQDASANNLTNSTTNSWSWVDDAPAAAPGVVDFVQQVVVRSTSYMEWQLRAMPLGYDAPVLVCLAAAMHPVGGTTTNAAAFRLVSGANASTEAAIDTSIASNTLEYRKHHYTTEPGGATWTTAMAQAPLKARFGFDGTSITAPPALDALMAFVVAPYNGVPPDVTTARAPT